MTTIWDQLTEKFDFVKNSNDSGLAGNIEIAWPEMVNIINDNLTKGSRILDFGCGTGGLSKLLYKSGYGVVGIDVSSQMIAKARELNSDNIIFETGSFELLKTLGTFDAIVSSMVFQFVPENEIQNGLFLLNKCLKNNGIIVFAVHNLDYVNSIQGSKYNLSKKSANSYKGEIELDNHKVDFYLRTAGSYRKIISPLHFEQVSESYPEYTEQFLKTHYTSQGRTIPECIKKYLIMAFKKLNAN